MMYHILCIIIMLVFLYNYKILRREFAEETYYTNGEAELLLKLYKRYTARSF